MMTIPYGGKVMVIQPEGEWTQVIYDDAVGYVMSAYLVDEEPPAKPTTTPRPTQEPSQEKEPVYDPTLQDLQYSIPAQVLSSGGLNLRRYCSKEAEVLTVIPDQAYLRVLKEGKDWCQVIYEEETGYCMTQYLKLILW